jgi:hypothetical protein
MDTIPQPHLMKEDKRFQESQFRTQSDLPLLLALQNITVNVRQTLGEHNRILWIIFYFRNQRIQVIKKKMGIQLILQSDIL